MRDRDLYAKLLGIEAPWFVRDVDARLDENKVEVVLGFEKDVRLACPDCGASCGRYDTRTRSWRHLDTMQYRAVLTADVPRVECKEHGVKQVAVPWAGPGSRFTALFESLVIDWLHGTSVTGVAQTLHMSWDEVDGITQPAVERGLKRRESQPLRRIGIDETSFQKRHEYVTVVYDVERTRVIEVLNGRKQDDLEKFFWDTPLEHILTLESVSMDMWPAYINAVSCHMRLRAPLSIGSRRAHRGVCLLPHVNSPQSEANIIETRRFKGRLDPVERSSRSDVAIVGRLRVDAQAVDDRLLRRPNLDML